MRLSMHEGFQSKPPRKATTGGSTDELQSLGFELVIMMRSFLIMIINRQSIDVYVHDVECDFKV